MNPTRWTIGMLCPVLGFLTAIFLAPFLYMVWLSFTDLSFAAADKSGHWIGLANYSRALFHDGIFLGSLWRSLLFAVLCVAPEIILGIAIAEFLHGRPLAQRLLTPFFALPVLWPGPQNFHAKIVY